MQVNLPEDLARYVEERVRRGDFVDESQAVQYALTVIRDQEVALSDDEVEELRAQLDPAIAEADRGETSPWSASEVIQEGERLLQDRAHKRAS
jgi:Arc/MetJ-type ribon-helix-helix transcriptional regulator